MVSRICQRIYRRHRCLMVRAVSRLPTLRLLTPGQSRSNQCSEVTRSPLSLDRSLRLTRASSGLKPMRRRLTWRHLTRSCTKRRMWTSPLRMSFVNSGVKLRPNSQNLQLKTMSWFAFKSLNSFNKVIRKPRGRGRESSSSIYLACQSSPHAIISHVSLMMAQMKMIMTMTWARKELNPVVLIAVIIQLVRCHLKTAATPALW